MAKIDFMRFFNPVFNSMHFRIFFEENGELKKNFELIEFLLFYPILQRYFKKYIKQSQSNLVKL